MRTQQKNAKEKNEQSTSKAQNGPKEPKSLLKIDIGAYDAFFPQILKTFFTGFHQCKDMP